MRFSELLLKRLRGESSICVLGVGKTTKIRAQALSQRLLRMGVKHNFFWCFRNHLGISLFFRVCFSCTRKLEKKTEHKDQCSEMGRLLLATLVLCSLCPAFRSMPKKKARASSLFTSVNQPARDQPVEIIPVPARTCASRYRSSSRAGRIRSPVGAVRMR